jgi:hypothetical protein
MASTNPIIRSTPEKRLANFQANSTSIYNKFSPFTNNGIGPSQPFVYTKISDSNISRNLTKYDTQAFPIGSTARDLKRIGQYMITGKGLLYTSKQLLLQNTNAFNETRIYNPLSLLKATAKPGSLGLINYPQRHLETSGGILNFFKDALLSTIGYSTKDANRPRIDGTATGVGGVAFSAYAGARGGARSGLLRFGTANKASSIFNETWVANPTTKNSGGFLAKLGSALLSKIKSFIPSTNPMGAFGGSAGETWKYRPEYQTGKDGIYYSFLDDGRGFLNTTTTAYPEFYNGEMTVESGVKKAYIDFHKYWPASSNAGGAYATKKIYASSDDVKNKIVGVGGNSISGMYDKMLKAVTDQALVPQQRGSTERYGGDKIKVKNPDGKEWSYPTYKDIPQKDFERRMSDLGSITLNEKGFAKVSSYSDVSSGKVSRDASDTYNKLGVLNGDRKNIHREITGYDENQSQDLIFFYFFDLINNVYIPFRATISSLTDQHSADWEDINYLGRADKLFLYKGFSRDTSFSFTVYANSAKEMLPMWNRINYLVGLTKPSKYTEKAVVTRDTTNEDTVRTTFANAIQAASAQGDQQAVGSLTNGLSVFESGLIASGKESKFIYPPMVTLRLGDLFYDQPCVISSVGINIPDDTNWESLREDNYYYDSSPKNRIEIKGTKSRQLPMKVDVQVQLKMLEKRQALGSDGHYGNSDGKDWKL